MQIEYSLKGMHYGKLRLVQNYYLPVVCLLSLWRESCMDNWQFPHVITSGLSAGMIHASCGQFF